MAELIRVEPPIYSAFHRDYMEVVRECEPLYEWLMAHPGEFEFQITPHKYVYLAVSPRMAMELRLKWADLRGFKCQK